MSGTARLWAAGADVYAAILTHPFVLGLTDGSLDPAAFERYVVQDAHYLRGYARALALVAAHAPGEVETGMFAQHAADAIAVERQLHTSLLAELGMSAEQAAREPVAPVTRAYVDHLIATCATGSFAAGVAAVLPCYWIYAEVGRELLARSSPDPRYSLWIATYGGEAFQQTVADVLAVAERVMNGLPGPETAAVADIYRRSAQYEWLFWDGAYRDVRWPEFPAQSLAPSDSVNAVGGE